MSKKNRETEKISLKKPLLAAIVSCIVALLVSTCAFAYFFLDLGKEKTVLEVPDLVGIDAATIDSNGFEHFTVEKVPVYSDSVKRGTVISQSPAGKAKRVFRGEDIAIKLKVSLGSEKHQIPDLCGFDCYEAACRLRELGVAVRFVYIYDENIAPDKVVRSSPAADKTIEKGDKVTLFVSREQIKHSVRVRDFSLMSREDAVRVLMSDGLTLGRIIKLPSIDEYAGLVIGQSIREGAFVRWGTKIDITVAERGEASGFFSAECEEDTEKIENGE